MERVHSKRGINGLAAQEMIHAEKVVRRQERQNPRTGGDAIPLGMRGNAQESVTKIKRRLMERALGRAVVHRHGGRNDRLPRVLTVAARTAMPGLSVVVAGRRGVVRFGFRAAATPLDRRGGVGGL